MLPWLPKRDARLVKYAVEAAWPIMKLAVLFRGVVVSKMGLKGSNRCVEPFLLGFGY